MSDRIIYSYLTYLFSGNLHSCMKDSFATAMSFYPFLTIDQKFYHKALISQLIESICNFLSIVCAIPLWRTYGRIKRFPHKLAQVVIIVVESVMNIGIEDLY